MEHFYLETNENSGSLKLTGEEHLHCSKVKRHKIGDEIHVINGRGRKYVTLIKDIKRAETILEVKEVKEFPKENIDIIIGISPTKNASRLEWFVEKATEIGVSQIYIIQCERSEKKSVKEERLFKIVTSALKQSGRYWLPKIQYFNDFYSVPFEKELKNFNTYIAHCEKEEPHLQSVIESGKPTFVAIGPEGDFTQQEISYALEAGCKPVSLGSNRLRTETAGLYALMTFMLQ